MDNLVDWKDGELFVNGTFMGHVEGIKGYYQFVAVHGVVLCHNRNKHIVLAKINQAVMTPHWDQPLVLRRSAWEK